MFLKAVGVSTHTRTRTQTDTHPLLSFCLYACVCVCVCGQGRVCLPSGDEQVRLPAAVTHCVSPHMHEDGMCVFKQ